MNSAGVGFTRMSLTVRAYHRPEEKGKLYLLAQLAQAKGYSLFTEFVRRFKKADREEGLIWTGKENSHQESYGYR